MSLTRRSHLDRGLDRLDPQQDAQSPAFAGGLNPMMFAQLAGGGGNAFAQSLLSPSLSDALAGCFGPGVAGLQLATGEDGRNAAMGALASTEGRRVSLSSKVNPARGDRQSLRVLGHEVAHGLAGGGSGEHELDRPGDPGEARADHAGERFADYVLSGMQGPAPKLEPAHGGRAKVHREEDPASASSDQATSPASDAGTSEELLAGGDAFAPYFSAYTVALNNAFANSASMPVIAKEWRALASNGCNANELCWKIHEAAVDAVLNTLEEPERKKFADYLDAKPGQSLASRMVDTYVLARVLSPSSYGLSYPTGAELGDESLDIRALLDRGRDPTVAADAEQQPLKLNATLPEGASLEQRAAHLAQLLGASRLPAEHLVTAHEHVEALYAGDHAAEIAAAGLPATKEEVYRALQERVNFANQRDNRSRFEKSDGGTCNLTAVGMAMQAAGIAPPATYKGVALDGMQFEEKLLTIANLDGKTDITSGAVWRYVVTACGGTFKDLGKAGELPMKTWQAIQAEHLDQGHGVFLSNNGHIVRLQSVSELGLVVDEVYGDSEVLETETHPSTLTAKYQSGSQIRDVSIQVWKKGDYYAKYTSENGFEEHLDDAGLKAAFQAELARQVEDPEAWSMAHPISKVKRKGGDRKTLKANAAERDREAPGYSKGEDTTWQKASVEKHAMNSVIAVYR